MFEGTKRGLSVAREATTVFWERPSLLVFPVGAVMTLVATYALLFRLALALDFAGQTITEAVTLLVAFYLVTGFLWTFFTAGLVDATGRHIRDQNVSVTTSLHNAIGITPLIARWTLVKLASGSIVVSTSARARRIAHKLCSSPPLDLDWRHAKYLVLPAAVFERPDGVAETVGHAVDVFERSSAEDRPNIVGAVMLLAVPVVVALLILGTIGGGVLTLGRTRITVGVAMVLAFGRLGLAFVLALTLDAVVKTDIYVRHVETRNQRTPVSNAPPDSDGCCSNDSRND